MSTLNKELLEMRCITPNYCRIILLCHNKKSSSLDRAVARASRYKRPEGVRHTRYLLLCLQLYCIFTQREIKNLQKSCQKMPFGVQCPKHNFSLEMQKASHSFTRKQKASHADAKSYSDGRLLDSGRQSFPKTQTISGKK